MLAVVTCHFNPCKFRKPVQNYWQFRRSLESQFDGPLVTVELSFDGHFIASDSIKIDGDENNLMWQKERLLNIGIESLPDSVDAVAWIDADIVFIDPNWPRRAEALLQTMPAVQLFSSCHFSDRHGSLYSTCPSFCYVHQHGRKPKQRFAPGGAWAARRDVLRNGLYDADIVGGADTSMIESWGGDQGPYAVYRNRYSNMPASLSRYDEWARLQVVNGNLGYLPGEAVHLHHGDRETRQYTSRYAILANHGFDLDADVCIGENGVWQWASEKPQLHKAVQYYFARRREDE